MKVVKEVVYARRELIAMCTRDSQKFNVALLDAHNAMTLISTGLSPRVVGGSIGRDWLTHFTFGRMRQVARQATPLSPARPPSSNCRDSYDS